MDKADKIEALEAEVERLREDCAEAYQAFGGLAFYFKDDEHKDCEKVLDNLWAASCGEPRPHTDVLPWPKGSLTYVPDGDV